MRNLFLKTKPGRWLTGAMAGVIFSATAAPAMADTIWVKNYECRINAYSMYQNLSTYHLYTYYADAYYQAYKQMLNEARRHTKNRELYKQLMQYAQMYIQIHYFYSQYSYMYLNWYIYSLIYFHMCEYWRPRNNWGQADQ